MRRSDAGSSTLRAASRLFSTPVWVFHPARCRDESRHGTHECVRHIAAFLVVN